MIWCTHPVWMSIVRRLCTPVRGCRCVVQYSSLEPEVVCRLLFVKDVEFVDSPAAEAPASLRPPLGQTELPTCPVCLERLDEHISGVVTTVSQSSCCMALSEQWW